MESFLKTAHQAEADLAAAINWAIDAWSVGHMTLDQEAGKELPDRPLIVKHRQEQLATAGIEAAVLERHGKNAIRYRPLTDDEVRSSVRD
jgi:hypothetical protein